MIKNNIAKRIMRNFHQKIITQMLTPDFTVRLVALCIVFFGFTDAYSQDTIVKSGDTWSYLDKGTIDIESNSLLKSTSINWSEGPTPIGFGQGDEATMINNINEDDSILTYFVFRKTITLNNPEEYKSFLLRLVRDDGAVIYVNDKEVVRSNLPEGKISQKTLASTLVSGLAEYTFYEYFVSPSYFQKGENVLTVILFQFRPISSDCRFDMELLGYKDYKILNSLIYNINSDRKLLEHQLELYTVKRLLNEKTDEVKFLNLKHLTNRNTFLIIIGLLAVTIILLIGFLIASWKKNNNIILKHRLLEKESEEKSKELINLSLSLLKIKQFVSSLLGDLQNVHKESEPGQQVKIEKLINRIEFHKHYEEDWERLKMHFDTIHSGFFARLKSKYPELTQSELRHCTYIKLQMFTSEIAQMLNIDNKSVQASRYRIKKKMQLPQDVDLKKFLEDF
jgi:DNA-binding CsgD family transcriptional regulator